MFSFYLIEHNKHVFHAKKQQTLILDALGTQFLLFNKQRSIHNCPTCYSGKHLKLTHLLMGTRVLLGKIFYNHVRAEKKPMCDCDSAHIQLFNIGYQLKRWKQMWALKKTLTNQHTETISMCHQGTHLLITPDNDVCNTPATHTVQINT